MKIAVLFALLLALQGTPQPQQKTTHAPTSNQQGRNNSTTKQRSETPEPAQSGVEAHQTIIIREPAQAPMPGKDCWEKTSVVFSGLLVLVGVVGTFYAIKTLKAVERQAEANEDQLREIQQSAKKTDRMIELAAQESENAKAAADAAKKSADTLRGAERPWLFMQLPKNILRA
jgi:hypothetical protein